MSRRRQRGRSLDLIPLPREAWAASIWEDREEVARTEAGAWMLREAAACGSACKIDPHRGVIGVQE